MKKYKRKRWKFKLFLAFLIFLFIFIFSIHILDKNNVSFNNTQFLRFILESSNPFIKKSDKKNLSYYVVKQILKIDLLNPGTIFESTYTGSILTSSDEVNTEVGSEYVEDPYPSKEVIDPIVYIYNTHQLEKYSTSNIEEYNIVPNVMMASYILREKLYSNGISAIVETADVNSFLQTNNWNYASSYKVTRLLMEDAKEKNPTLRYFLDLHRDSVKKEKSTIVLDEKNYAKILFIVGMENSNYQENLNVTQLVLDKLENNYPGITRGIYKKKGPGVNGVYNQDFDKNVILIELGGSENTIDEVMNSTLALSDVLTTLIKEGSI